MRYLLSVAGGIPFVGGAVAGAGSFWGEAEHTQVNHAIAQWAKTTDADLDVVIARLDALLTKPSTATLAVLLIQMFGEGTATHLMETRPSQIHGMLNSTTVSELEPFIECGLVAMRPTGNVASMGTGCKAGGAVEELKRPYGMGSGQLITILAD